MHVQCIQFDIGIDGSKIMQSPQVKLVCFESVLLEGLEFQQKKFNPLLNTFSFPLTISSQLSLISKTVFFFIEMFGICEGH